MSFHKSTINYIFGVLIFLFTNELYYNFFILNNAYINDAANFHDYYVYTMFIRYIEEGKDIFVFGNNYGIASIYSVLGFIFNTKNYILLSHYVNITVFLFATLYTFKLFRMIGLPLIFSIFFIFNPANFYYMSLINKDIFSILFVLIFVYYLLRKKYLIFTILAFLSVVIRMQLPLFAITLFFLMNYKKISMKKKIILLYILSAVGAVILENSINIINDSSMGTSLGLGISKIIRELNANYYIGSLFLNPIKVIQYFYDYLTGYSYIFNFSSVHIYRVKDFLNLIFLPLSMISLFLYALYGKEPIKKLNIFLLVIISFFTVWLINPTVNYRYIGIFIPYFLIPGIYASVKLFRREA